MTITLASILIIIIMTIGIVAWIDWINRIRIRWNNKRTVSNQTHTNWEFIKHILRRHNQ